MSLVIKSYGLTIEDLVAVSRNGKRVDLHPDSLEKIKKCRAMLEDKIQAHEIMYGVNTGI
jgi:histidine ammonia-lyase